MTSNPDYVLDKQQLKHIIITQPCKKNKINNCNYCIK